MKSIVVDIIKMVDHAVSLLVSQLVRDIAPHLRLTSAVYFHIRASCITLKGGRRLRCPSKPCSWGHDYIMERQHVMGM